ncbi:MAG: tetratricopeptide repeat protein [Bacteroidota bacterium]|nr:tetratricopeptide repeat protein [Bacteroidota bacterium]
MKKIFLFLLSIAFVFNSSAQIIDSLKRALAIAKEDTTKVNILVLLSYYDGSYENGLKLSQEALALAKKIKYEKGEAESMHQLANQFRIVNNYILALHYYIESLKIKERLNDQAGYSRSLSGIGSVYRIQGDYQSALSYFNRALEIQNKFKYNHRQAYTSSQIGETYEIMDQPDSALLYFQTSYAYFNADKDKFNMVKSLNGLGRVQSKLGNADLALSYFRMGTINAIAYTDSIELAENYLGIAKLFQKTEKIDSSILYAKKAISVTQNKNGEVVIEANKLLFNLYLNNNDKEAIKYLSKAMDARDSTFSADKVLQIQSISFAEEERQKEINEKKLKDVEERKHNLQYAAITIALITFIIVFFILSRSIIVKTKFIEFFGVLGLLAVFEFINLFIHPYLAHATNDSPVLMLVVLIAIGALLIPLHHRLEKWITKIMVEKNKKIRLNAAKKTIQQLEG